MVKGYNYMKDKLLSAEYDDWLKYLKQQIKQTQIKASISVNSQLIMLYWDLGRQIVEKQDKAKWGSKFIEQLSRDLKAEFPEMTGFSKDNLFQIKRFYQFYLPLTSNNTDFEVPESTDNTNTQIVEQLVQLLQHTDDKNNSIIEQLVQQLRSDNQYKPISKEFVYQLNMNKLAMIP
jgi:hypothetical protein